MGLLENLPPEALSSLVDASAALNAHLTLEEKLMAIARSAAAVMKTEGASVIMIDKVRGKQVFRAAVGDRSDQLIGMEYEEGIGVSGKAMRDAAPVVVNDVTRDKSFYREIDSLVAFQTRSIIACPLISSGNVLGVVEVVNPINGGPFKAEDVKVAQVFANMAAIATTNAQLYERLSREHHGLKQSIPQTDNMIGTGPAMAHVHELIARVARSSATVLLLGETGTGKELAARKIHALSLRRDRPFIAINCAALPETLLESELFGHEAGAFTGAKGRKVGRFELADGGTIFLDEIGEVAMTIQVKLLRVLQEKEIVRVGGTQTVSCNVRIIAATNRDLAAEMKAKHFREDLYYRLNVFPIKMPPLRARREDIPLLARSFVARLATEMNKPPGPQISPQALAALGGYKYPGNIRELQNILERACLLCCCGADGDSDDKPETIMLEHLPPELVGVTTRGTLNFSDSSLARGDAIYLDGGGAYGDSALEAGERAMVAGALREAGWNQSKAARALGISRDNIRYRMRKYGIKAPD